MPFALAPTRVTGTGHRRVGQYEQVVMTDEPEPYTFLEPDAAAIIGVLAILAGEVLGGNCRPELLAHLGRRLERTGAITDPASADQVYEALEDLIAQVRYVAGRVEDERPPHQLDPAEPDPTAPPKGISGWIAAQDVPLGSGPEATCVLGSVVAYPTGIEIEVNLAWSAARETASGRPPAPVGRFTPPMGFPEPIGDWQLRVELPDGRTVVSDLSGASRGRLAEEPLRAYTQSVQTERKIGTVFVRWISWTPVRDVPWVRVTSGWPFGGVPETSHVVDLMGE